MAKQNDVLKFNVTFTGMTDIMFDRYAGDNKTALPVEQKLYYAQDGSLVFPAANLMSLLSAQNTTSAPKRLLDKREYKSVAQGCLSYVAISPQLIPLTRNGNTITPQGFTNDRDPAGLYVHRCVARLDKGIPNPKVRPVVELPWELSFNLTLFKNPDVGEDMLYDLLSRGGIAIGIGTYRGVFGKFSVSRWENA